MHLDFAFLHFADIFGDGFSQIARYAIPIAGIILAGVIAVSAMYFHNRRREMWHETARLALEKGQPLPKLPDDEEIEHQRNSERLEPSHDVRGGLVLIAVGFGLYVFLGAFLGHGLAMVGAIPGFIGVALLLYAMIAKNFGRKNQPPHDPTSRP